MRLGVLLALLAATLGLCVVFGINLWYPIVSGVISFFGTLGYLAWSEARA